MLFRVTEPDAASQDPDLAALEGVFPKVVISTLSGGQVPHQFFSAWTSMLLYDAKAGRRILSGGGTIECTSSPRIVPVRTDICRQFLSEPDMRYADWLLLCDSDMVPEADAIERLLRSAYSMRDGEHDHIHAIGGLCFAGGRAFADETASLFPTLYERIEVDGKGYPKPVTDYPRDQIVKVYATGAAFLMVHRDLLMAMLQPHPHGFGTMRDGSHNPYPWFFDGINEQTGMPLGEDITFCIRAQQVGYGVYVDTAVKVGHVKSHLLTEELFDAERGAAPVAQHAGRAGSSRAERRRAAREAVKASR